MRNNNSNSSQSRSNSKRRLALKKTCKIELKKELNSMFEAFADACANYEAELRLTPPESRARGFEASLLNSKMIQSIRSHFPNSCRFGRYKRFILNVKGYIILFKKLNSKGLPMNIKTRTSGAITKQLSLSLFGPDTYVADPILFFGYQKNKFGQILSPKLVYVDEDKVRWTITYEDLSRQTKQISRQEIKDYPMPKLKKNQQKKSTGS